MFLKIERFFFIMVIIESFLRAFGVGLVFLVNEIGWKEESGWGLRLFGFKDFF